MAELVHRLSDARHIARHAYRGSVRLHMSDAVVATSDACTGLTRIIPMHADRRWYWLESAPVAVSLCTTATALIFFSVSACTAQHSLRTCGLIATPLLSIATRPDRTLLGRVADLQDLRELVLIGTLAPWRVDDRHVQAHPLHHVHLPAEACQRSNRTDKRQEAAASRPLHSPTAARIVHSGRSQFCRPATACSSGPTPSRLRAI